MAAVVNFLLLIPIVFAATGTIDSTDKYAWGENIGWVNFGTAEGSVTVTDTALTGYAWGENIGWISLNCSNASSCATVDYKVANTTAGVLSGYAWSENAGWINFSPGVGSDPAINTSTGVFSGYAWGENIGWVNFVQLKTDWRPSSTGGGGSGPGIIPPPVTSIAPSATPAVTSVPSSSPSPTIIKPPAVSPPIEPPPGIVPSGTPGDSGGDIGIFPSLPPQVQEVLKQITTAAAPAIAVAKKIIQKAGQPISAVTGIGVAISGAASAVSLASSGVSLFSYLQYALSNLFVLFGIKKKTRAWGTVYNALTKQPLPFTKIQLLGSDQRVLETRITDRQGRYGFLINAGGIDPQATLDLQIRPIRDGFQFPSTRSTDASDTLLYGQLYRGGIVQVHPNELIKFDVPLEPIAQEAPSIKHQIPKVRLHNFLANISHAMFWIALIALPLTYIFQPTRFNLIMLIIFGSINLFVLIGDLRQRPYGVVVDRGQGMTVPYSLITLNDPAGQRKGFTVSDEQGRYFLLSDKGTYKISAHTPAQVNPPRSSEEELSTDHGWIAKKLDL